MRSKFIFDVGDLLNRAKKMGRVEGLTINLPFLSFNVKVEDDEKRVARETLIFLKNRRVFQPRKVEEHRVNAEVGSLKDIRNFLVDKQMALADYTEGALYLLIEFMLEGIRQFLTFHEQLVEKDKNTYHTVFGLLQAHLSSCISQAYKIADLELPEVYVYFQCDKKWKLDAYGRPL